MEANNLDWVDKDCEVFRKYNFCAAYMKNIIEFFEAKKAYLISKNKDTTYMLKSTFIYAHSALKAECSLHCISTQTLEELTELLRKGL